MRMNVHGWTYYNSIIGKTIINNMNPDILCISETHLQKEHTLRIDGYEYFPYNRTITHKDAPKTFGGI